MKFTVGGEEFSLEKKDVERKLKGIAPEPIQKLFVIVNGTKFPVKQALALSSGLIRAGFTTQYAFRIFRKLGFELGEE
jgi:hypothetical protein